VSRSGWADGGCEQWIKNNIFKEIFFAVGRHLMKFLKIDRILR
jgi:hypothetical protein